MSEMKYQNFVLTRIGWGVAVVLSMFVYVMYYLFLYPLLSTVQVRQNLHSAYDRNEKSALSQLEISVSAPIYLANFQSSQLDISLKNLGDKSINGVAVIVSTMPGAKGRLMFNNIPQNEYKIPFLLDSGGSENDSIDIKLSNAESYCVNLKVEIRSSSNPTDADAEFLVYSPTVVKWENAGYQWRAKFPNSECANQVLQNQNAPNVFFYATNHPYGAFAESTLVKLLLPPWSGLSLLVMVFSVVWLLEQFVPIEWLDDLKNREFVLWSDLIKYAMVLFVFSALLLTLVTIGIVFVFLNINKVAIYFGFIIVMIVLLPLVAWVASWFFQKQVTILSWKPLLDKVDYWADYLKDDNYPLAMKSVREFCEQQNIPNFIPDLHKKLSALLNNQTGVEYRNKGWVFTGGHKACDIISQALQTKMSTPVAPFAPETPIAPSTSVTSEVPSVISDASVAAAASPIPTSSPKNDSIAPKIAVTPDVHSDRKNSPKNLPTKKSTKRK